eukprot:TRINITY_DN21757_c0_g1_i1.p1 TRINITY_DN21757_c0_g1~~TRINITY_DN21757_c0_g1_i1.p1  ORF type:complete len:291 (+),score=96.50 TRINITY_DN21757_c0_g1_i1:64-936(+)
MHSDSDDDRGRRRLAMPRNLGAIVCVGVVLLVVLWISSLRTVPSAHLGVVTTFGFVSSTVLRPGMHICNPFAQVVEFSTKTQLLEQHNVVPTAEGLNIDLDVAVLFHVVPDQVPDIFTSLGQDYVDVLVKPSLSSAVRELTSQGEAKALYSNGRGQIELKLRTLMDEGLKKRGIILESVLMKGMVLPEQLKRSIEAKAQAEQEAARMEFVLQKEKQEAERKKIEAQGIAEFQRIVSQGISPQLLQWKGIEATEKFSSSPNAKIVIMGNTKTSLPVMFSGDIPADKTPVLT